MMISMASRPSSWLLVYVTVGLSLAVPCVRSVPDSSNAIITARTAHLLSMQGTPHATYDRLLLLPRMDSEIQETHTPAVTPPQTPPRTPPKTPGRLSPAIKGVSPARRISPSLKGARSGRRKVSFADLGPAALSRNPSETQRGVSHRTGTSSSPDKTIILWSSGEVSHALNSGTLRSLGFDTDTSLPDFPPYSPPAKGVWGKMKKMTRRVFGKARGKPKKKPTVWSKVRNMARW